MEQAEIARALDVFDAFLVHVRGAAGPIAPAPVKRAASADAEDDVEPDTEVTRVSSVPTREAEKTMPTPSWDEPTNEAPEVVRALARSDAAQPDTDLSIPLPGRLPAVDPRVAQESIIIEDDSLTEPEFRREDVLRAMAEHARLQPAARPAPPPAAPPAPLPPPITVEQFAVEMKALVKWGHGAQAAAETDRWLAARPEDAAVLAEVSRGAGRGAPPG